LVSHDVTATFFTVGAVAREYPEVVDRIAAAGHEVASHGDSHTPLSDLDRGEFERELTRSATAIKAATGQRPHGFRAPNFSLSGATSWAVDVLADHGYDYDASVFPVKTPMYGLSGAPVRPYGIRATDLTDPTPDPTERALVELPAAVFHPHLRVPVAGGFYGRVLPRRVLGRGIRNLNAHGIPATLYFHPWEFNRSVPIDGLPSHKRFVSFYGIDRLADKLNWLLHRYPFDTAREVVSATDTTTDSEEHA
jgi:polysaccharide deacetylase family protein (PEP-CTERM system associated)